MKIEDYKGIVVSFDPNLVVEQQEITKEFKQGRPKSGKMWKKSSKKSSNMYKGTPGFLVDWKERQELKQSQQELKEKVQQLKTIKDDMKKAENKRAKDKRKRKELNEFKSGQYQLIKDTSKVRKWSKKARATLQKVPSEMFEELLKKNYR